MDDGDISRVYFQDLKTKKWHALDWEHAAACGGQFSAEALAYARRLAAATHRFPNATRALIELLNQWDAGLTRNPTERRIAIRVSEQRLRLVPDDAVEDDEPLPSVTSSAPAITNPAALALAGVPDDEGDDDDGEELDAAFPGEEIDEDDFYADAMESA